LNRRHFLGAAAGGLGGLGGGLGFAVEGDRRPQFTFALATDTHLSRQAGDDERLRQLVAEINASPAQFTLFCGDLVDNGQAEGKEKQYTIWKDIAKGLKQDYFAVPGNHEPDPLFLKHIAEKTDFVFEQQDFRFVCFRNAEPNPGHDGVVTPEQLQWLEARLAEARDKDQRVVLASHVAYHENKHPDVGWYLKRGREESPVHTRVWSISKSRSPAHAAGVNDPVFFHAGEMICAGPALKILLLRRIADHLCTPAGKSSASIQSRNPSREAWAKAGMHSPEAARLVA
jgi:predicted phosphodiesterase